MTEKKSLDFDFLDDATPKMEVKKDTPPVESAPVTETGKINAFQYFKECFSDFSAFAKRHLTRKSPMYIVPVVWFVGMGTAGDNLIGSESSDWGEVWAITVFGGLLSGALSYYIGGWFYHIRVQWSQGQGDISTARNIYMFASLPIAVTSLGSLLINNLVYGSTYWTLYSVDASTVDLIFGLLAFAAIGYSIYLSYHAVRDVMQASKGRALTWFVILPAIFYVTLFVIAAS